MAKNFVTYVRIRAVTTTVTNAITKDGNAVGLVVKNVGNAIAYVQKATGEAVGNVIKSVSNAISNTQKATRQGRVVSNGLKKLAGWFAKP